jgi:hypothetical protein
MGDVGAEPLAEEAGEGDAGETQRVLALEMRALRGGSGARREGTGGRSVPLRERPPVRAGRGEREAIASAAQMAERERERCRG